MNNFEGFLLTSKNGVEYKFIYRCKKQYQKAHSGNILIFEIWETGRESFDTFSFMLRIMENGSDLKVVDLFPDHLGHYLGKGISVAIILHCKELFKKRIISDSFGSNWASARKNVWEKMREKGTVMYDAENDFYYTT